MTFAEVVTGAIKVLFGIVFVLGIPAFLTLMAFKLSGIIAWGWTIVCLPAMIVGFFVLLGLVAMSIYGIKAKSKISSLQKQIKILEKTK